LARAAFLVSSSFLEEGERSSDSSTSHSARAAFDLGDTVGIFADKLAFGLGAVGFVAFPVALGLFAYGFALRLGSLTMSDAMGSLADSDALRAVKHLASLVRALNFTFRFLALHVTESILWFGT
jgi:hypothetical protein